MPPVPDEEQGKELPTSRKSDSVIGDEQKRSTPQLSSRVIDHLKQDVSPIHADMILLCCCFVSGLIDGVAFNSFGAFASMQTGNTIFVGLGASGQPRGQHWGWAKSLMAIGCFMVGCFCFGHAHRLLHPLRRVTLLLSFAVQFVCIIIAAAIVQGDVISGSPDQPFFAKELAPLALLAFQSSGQIVAGRNLGYNELPTVVLTSVYCDLFSDAKLFTSGIHENPKRNRRALAVVCLFAGAVIGGFMSKEVGLGPALWLAAGIKGVLVICWIIWRKKTTPVRLADDATIIRA